MRIYVMVGKPDETVYKITSLPRWQRDWINNHRSINYSGLVQEMLRQIIEKNDPHYYDKNKKYIVQPRRYDTTFNVLS